MTVSIKLLLDQRSALQAVINEIDFQVIKTYSWQQIAAAGFKVFACRAYMRQHARSLQEAKDAVDDYCKS